MVCGGLVAAAPGVPPRPDRPHPASTQIEPAATPRRPSRRMTFLIWLPSSEILQIAQKLAVTKEELAASRVLPCRKHGRPLSSLMCTGHTTEGITTMAPDHRPDPAQIIGELLAGHP